MTVYEIVRGLKATGATQQLAQFNAVVASSDVIPIDTAILMRAADLWAEGKRGGHPSDDADLIIAANPWALNPALREVSHTLFTAADAMGPSQMTMQASRTPFLDKNRAALMDFFTDAMASLRWFHDPANRDEAVTVVAKISKQPREQLAQYLFTDQDPYSDPNLRPDLESLQRSVGVMRELGFIKDDVEVKKYVDLSFIDEASRRLNK